MSKYHTRGIYGTSTSISGGTVSAKHEIDAFSFVGAIDSEFLAYDSGEDKSIGIEWTISDDDVLSVLVVKRGDVELLRTSSIHEAVKAYNEA